MNAPHVVSSWVNWGRASLLACCCGANILSDVEVLSVRLSLIGDFNFDHEFKVVLDFSTLLFSCSVMSDSLWPHGLQRAGLLSPSPTPGVCSNSYPSSQWHLTLYLLFNLSLAHYKQPVGRHFKIMQISCFSLKSPLNLAPMDGFCPI